ncbi:hypothetical protein NMY22_g5990 [Coprinellus aureogranulatus]|nr:hypothetical protein NMY22_g5990 [Coprinellus aureogranulatus]
MGGSEYRLTDLGLPDRFMRIAGSPQSPSVDDLEFIERISKDCARKLSAIEELLELEQMYPGSPLSRKLVEALPILQCRLAGCATVRSAWRKLPFELWDRIFTYYLAIVRTAPLETWSADQVDRQASCAPQTLSSTWSSPLT